MTTTTMKSFAHSSGQSANQKSGQFSGALLGKVAEGLEALEAIKALALGHANKFMQLAMEAVHVTAKKLEAVGTKPFASQDLEFNAALNPVAAAAPNTPGLGSTGKARQRKSKKETND